ncbi:nucleocapsid protein [Coleopteran arli-related virus OKIAV107]|uniref:Nucleocapsid protein n=1 Tax=Coleopteran arli-related virus OKIAV107 TaxID=2746353 RepID=A0AAE7IFD4_9MONO|nr:nucleocapsid protein [Coleopteran arli-related virus OKIAV107]QMP82312.1 nucleocapsid protein [Coleopteran arli-related virus OKIAV107]
MTRDIEISSILYAYTPLLLYAVPLYYIIYIQFNPILYRKSKSIKNRHYMIILSLAEWIEMEKTMYLRLFFTLLWLINPTLEMYDYDIYKNKHCFLDDSKGVILYDDGPVFLYDYFIYLPIIINIPNTPFKTGNTKCELELELSKRVNEVISTLVQKIPSLNDHISSIGKKTDIDRLSPKKVVIKHTHQFFVEESEPKVIDILGLNNQEIHKSLNRLKRKVSKRSKRFVLTLFLVILGVIALSAATGAVTGSIALAKVNNIESNQDSIVAKVNQQTDAINLMTINQEHIISITQNITLKVNELIRSHECLKYSLDAQLKLINSWSAIVPNSFMRALNGLLAGQVNVDIIPGDQLSTIMGMYPSFDGTIFEENPFLLYKSSTSKLIKVMKNPLMLEGLIITPRIKKVVYGRRYVQRSCIWKQDGNYYSLKEELSAIRSNLDGSWWDTSGCLYQDGVTLCDQRKLRAYHNKCLGTGTKWDISSCHLLKHVNFVKNQVIQTPNGILVCDPSSHVVLFKADLFNVLNTRILNMSRPTLITPKMADNILVGTNHYPIVHSGPVINITELIIFHNNSYNMSMYDTLDLNFNMSHVNKIDQLYIQHYSNRIVYSVLSSIMVLLIISFGIYHLRNKKRNRIMKKRIGYVSYKISRTEEKDPPLKLEPTPSKLDVE